MKRLAMMLFTLVAASAQAGESGAIEAVLAHPPFGSYYTCGEHREGELQGPGDALGTDCLVGRLVEVEDRRWVRYYDGEGTRNEDWFGWKADLHAPCECTVVGVRINPETNEPGRLGKPPASAIVFRRDDGVFLLYAHVQDVAVAQGDRVAYGQLVAKVGNNGYGRSPHVHVGAWKEQQPLQIRWDLSVKASAEH